MIHKRTVLILLWLIFLTGCAEKQKPQDQVLLTEAEDLINYQSYDNAREKLIKCVELNPHNLKAYVLLGDVYYFQSNLIMYRMQILNLVFKYGHRLRWATPKELDLATATEEVLLLGMDSYRQALALCQAGAKDETIDPRYLNYELGWGYLAEEDLIKARESFRAAVTNGEDRWDTKSALVFLNYLQDQQNQVKLDELRLKEEKEREKFRQQHKRTKSKKGDEKKTK